MITTYTQDINTYVSKLSDGMNYFLIFLMFALLIAFAIFIIFFAKWLTLGPKYKAKWQRMKDKAAGRGPAEGVVVKKGEIIIDNEYVNELEAKIKNANTPQELLELQILKEDHDKAKKIAEDKIKEDEEARLRKIEQKQERERLKAESKEQARVLQEKEKARKAKLKEQKEQQKGNK